MGRQEVGHDGQPITEVRQRAPLRRSHVERVGAGDRHDPIGEFPVQPGAASAGVGYAADGRCAGAYHHFCNHSETRALRHAP
jgi:hypothetical protein